ncbi:hypothetical protein MMC13_003285 [Lambiella insularis]|nr:hypothetical protein [Lambiella insularis]
MTTTPPPSAFSVSEKESTVLYLAYGSNLSAETFQGRRGIRPLAAINVVVPSLTMTFDLPGLPYSEPCFANTRYRSSKLSSSTSTFDPPSGVPGHTSLVRSSEEKLSSSSSSRQPRYHKDRWPHGLVGVVYEVTPSDYAHIIATEGGGASYQDITVACYPLPKDTCRVPEVPESTPFFAHTLFAPPELPGELEMESGGAIKSLKKAATSSRPDPSYAQPSARYLKLITDGATQHSFPPDYMSFLNSLQPYTITSQKQQLGQFIFLSIWSPIILFLFGLAATYGKKEGGKSPKWLVWLIAQIFVGLWVSYDSIFKGLFGDGERTVEGDNGGWDEGDPEWSWDNLEKAGTRRRVLENVDMV